jgi:hypothetical protein
LSNETGPIAIVGPGPGKLVIRGGEASRVFQVEKGASATLSGLTITGGATAGDGGGLLNLGSVTRSRDAIVGNSAAGSPTRGPPSSSTRRSTATSPRATAAGSSTPAP